MLAYIITVYKDADHLRRLIKSLNQNAHFFIHVDLKVPIQPFERCLEDFSNVRFTKRRFFINWGGFGQVLAQQELLRCVFSANFNYERVVCISGTDYPVSTNDHIHGVFKSRQEFIMGFNISRGVHEGQKRRVTLYHFFRDIKVKRPILKKIFSGGFRNIMRLLPFRKDVRVLIDGQKCDVFMGSDYWSLTSACARHVYRVMREEKSLMNYFKSSFVPSEMVVQTIVFNSRFKENAMLVPGVNYPALANLTPLHYIHYRRAIKIFKLDDLDEILASKRMFFRKAETGTSDLLLDKIDELRSNKYEVKHSSSI